METNWIFLGIGFMLGVLMTPILIMIITLIQDKFNG